MVPVRQLLRLVVINDDVFSGVETWECGCACVNSCIAEFFFDAEQLVVLVDAFATGWSTSLDLAGVGCNCQVSNGGVFGFAGTVGSHRLVACTVCCFDCFEGFGEGTNLVDLHQESVCRTELDTLFEALWVGNEQIVTNELDAATNVFGEDFHASHSSSESGSSMETIGYLATSSS